MNKYELATIASLNNLDDNNYHKLTAAQQREIFGFVIVGRKDIRFDSRNQGTVIIGRTVTSDYVSRDYSYEEFSQAINDRQPLEAW